MIIFVMHLLVKIRAYIQNITRKIVKNKRNAYIHVNTKTIMDKPTEC